MFIKLAARGRNSVLLPHTDTDLASLSLSGDSLIRCRRLLMTSSPSLVPSVERLRRNAMGASGSLVVQLLASFKIIANSK
jgi:hypothetical protein